MNELNEVLKKNCSLLICNIYNNDESCEPDFHGIFDTISNRWFFIKHIKIEKQMTSANTIKVRLCGVHFRNKKTGRRNICNTKVKNGQFFYHQLSSVSGNYRRS